jgi:hypothetical protein
MVGHTGNGGGFRNVLLFFPEDDLTVAVLTNTDAGSPVEAAVRIARAVLRLPAEPRPERPLPDGAGLPYSGTYESDEGRVTFFERDGALRFRQKDEDVTGTPLVYLGDGTFQFPGGTEARFVMKDGRAGAATAYVNGLFLDAVVRVP